MKPKGKVYEFYREILQDRKPVFFCKFCSQQYKNKNATRMTMHLIKNCKNCPEIIKLRLKGKSALLDVTNTNSSSTNFISTNLEAVNSKQIASDIHSKPFNEVSLFSCLI